MILAAIAVDYKAVFAAFGIDAERSFPGGRERTPKAALRLRVFSVARPAIRSQLLRKAVADFIKFCNHRRDYEGIGNVTPADVYYGRRDAILKRREEQKRVTIEERFRYNRSRSMTINLGELSLEP